MYKTVYWHSDVRIATALVKKALYLGLREGHIKAEELYAMDDDSFFRKMTETPEGLASLIRESETPRNYSIIAQPPFDESNRLHRELMDMDFRTRYEQELAKKIEASHPGLLPENHLILDIPSRISFEVDVPILDKEGKTSFTASPTVFSTPVVQGFTESLRHIKLIVPTFVARKISHLDLCPLSRPRNGF